MYCKIANRSCVMIAQFQIGTYSGSKGSFFGIPYITCAAFTANERRYSFILNVHKF